MRHSTIAHLVAAADEFLPLFENMLRVLPMTKTIAIVSGASPNAKFWQGVLKRELEALAGQVEIKWLNEMSIRGHPERDGQSSTEYRHFPPADERRCGAFLKAARG